MSKILQYCCCTDNIKAAKIFSIINIILNIVYFAVSTLKDCIVGYFTYVDFYLSSY